MKLVKPKKFLGQHFLKDLQVAQDIADTVDACPALPVLEVGPGMGVLTQYLLKKDRPLKVVELDFESVAYLRENFPQLGDHIIEQDFLKMDLRQLFDGQPFVLTGNYPYNISSQIFFKMLDYKDLIPCCTGMIQKEVAERIAARPGNKTYGILSVLIQAWYSVEYLFTVHEHVFNPPPKVKSAVIRMTRNETKELGCNEQLFKQIVKTTFNQRRKTLRNSISPILEKGNPLSADPIFNKRPEQLSVQDFIDLRHSERTDSSLVQRGIPVHRTRTCIQSSSQGEERRHPHDPQRNQGVRMQRAVVQADCQDDIQPAPQDAPQLHISDSGERKSAQCRPYLQQTA